ncbi:tetratricopeptide repeat protein [Tumebacillus sp. ITR2]|uniref:Tetratricopeptide repeat protein n=1 Tax=Tumebacillus amylolyticus TaxID=2801339 RepID=A0ABS1JBW8_9BACL|nr:helix-turn-helix transcriptional regulator [Tumebacillus amylolyticus]MBL0387767.1 tetratricopeptide repeat protein [Tumebacillus amylolyticus]
METFGQRLRQLRMKKGLTQMQLAEGIITPSMCSQMESDKARPSWHVLEKIAQKLEVSPDELIGNSQLNMAVTSEYRLVKGLLSAGEYSSALPLLEKVMRANNGKFDPFELRYDYAKCQLELHHFREAEETFQQLLEHANSNSGSAILAVRVLYQLGQIELKRKRLQLAEHYIALALSKLESTGVKDVNLQCSLLLTLGEVQKQVGQMKKAFVTYQLALPILTEREDIQGLGNLYIKLAQTAHNADDFQQAAEYSQRAQWCFETLNSQGEKLAIEVRLAVLQGEMGDRDKAIIDLERIVEEYRQVRREEEMGIAVIELAKLYYAGGNLDLAEGACQTGRTLLPTVHSYQAWGARVQAGIAQARSQHVVAIKYMKQAAECFKLTECQTEFEETMQELSHLYESTNDCHSALRVMHEMWSFNRQARENRGIVL